MGRTIQPARFHQGVPQVQVLAYATGQVFKRGAPVVDDVNGQIVETAADPQSIRGIALQDAGTGPGYGLADSTSIVFATGRAQEVSVAIADRHTNFTARGVNGGTDPVVPTQTHIGEQYSLAKVGNDWVIDMANPTTPAVEIVDILPELNAFVFKFIESVLAMP